MERFPPVDIVIKVALSLALGMLIGLEREWAHKDLGVRTFTITGLLGMLGALVSVGFSITLLLGVFLIIGFVNARSLIKDRSLETTTSAALMAAYVLGVLVGQGHRFTPVAVAILVTMLLTWKTELRRFAGGLLPQEVRSAVLLGLIAFVVYPILPDRFIDPWGLINPKETWLTVVLIAGIGFLNYLLLRLYGAKGLYYTAILGGLVNSTATVAELTSVVSAADKPMRMLMTPITLITVVAMAVRNIALLQILAPGAALNAAVPLAAVIVVALLLVWWSRFPGDMSFAELRLSSPISLTKVARFGALFVGIQVAAVLGQRLWGTSGFLVVSAVGGLVSSASTTAAAASMSAHGQLASSAAALATVIATSGSALVNLPLIWRQLRDRKLIVQLGVITGLLFLTAFSVWFIQNRNLKGVLLGE